MRLKQSQIEKIIQSIDHTIALNNTDLRLFGSRIHDHSKGGDIDLLLIVNNDLLLTQVLFKKIEIVVNIQSLLGDQKIDLYIVNATQVKADPFFQLILPTSILLYTWPGI